MELLSSQKQILNFFPFKMIWGGVLGYIQLNC